MMRRGYAYPKRMCKRMFQPLKGWNRGMWGATFIRVSGRRHPQMRKHRTWQKKIARLRRRDKRPNWLAIRDDLRRARKRDADRKAGRIPAFPRIQVAWDTAFVVSFLDQIERIESEGRSTGG